VNEWWRTLTTVRQKAEEFGRETYFREAWAEACEHLDAPAALFQRLAVITFKPEAIVARRVRPGLKFLAERGFRPVVHRRLRFSRHQVRELWRFQWNVATRERMAVMDLMNVASDSLWVALWDETDQLEMPGTVRFRALKGSSLPRERGPETLRAFLGGQNRIMTCLHAADEPIDIVREMGILYDAPDRSALLTELAGPLVSANPSLAETLEDLEREGPAIDFDIDRATAGLETALNDAAADADPALIAAARRTMLACQSGTPLPWHRFVAELNAARVRPKVWDLLQFGAHYVQHDLEEGVCTIDEDGRDGWLRGDGTLLVSPEVARPSTSLAERSIE
jgi:hypothetical protein